MKEVHVSSNGGSTELEKVLGYVTETRAIGTQRLVRN